MSDLAGAQSNPDVLIYGDGPAGCTAAIALCLRGYKVGILQRERLPVRDSIETLAPSGLHLLSALGAREEFEAWEGKIACDLSTVVWESHESRPRNAAIGPYGPPWHLRHESFAAFMRLSAKRRGAVFIPTSAGVPLDVEVNWPVFKRKPFLIDATGRAAWLSRRLGARAVQCDNTLALVADFDTSPSDGPAILIEARPEGWWYSAADGQGTLSVMLNTEPDYLLRLRKVASVEAIWRNLMLQARLTRKRVEGMRYRAIPRLVPCGPRYLTVPSGNGWLAIGDAALAHDPLSSNGLTFALESGLEAARQISLPTLQEGATEYDLFVARAVRTHLYQRRETYAACRRYSGHAFWHNRSECRSNGDGSFTSANVHAPSEELLA